MPPVTAADIAVPTGVLPFSTVNVTVPAFTVPTLLVTVAERATLCALELYVADAFVAVVVVVVVLTVSVCDVSLLVVKPPAAL